MRILILFSLMAALGGCTLSDKEPNISSGKGASQPRPVERIQIIELKNAPAQAYGKSRDDDGDIDATAASDGMKGIASTRNDKLLHPDDVIDVTILDTSEDGLFNAVNSKTLKIGRYTVNQSGSITLPFVGRIQASNLTATGLQAHIVKGLKGSAISPQAIVTVVEKPSDVVTVNGAVKTPGQFALKTGRERILDLLALAGGATAKTEQVTLVRSDKRVSASLDRIMNNSDENIYVQRGDQLILQDAPTAKFTVLGAFKNIGEFEFEPGQLTLAQAIARTGGITSETSDANNIYLFRSKSTEKPHDSTTKTTSNKSVIYKINIDNPSNYIIMQQFFMQDGDTIFVSNAPLTP